MVLWPGVTKGGTVNSNRVMIEDFYPTIIEMAGIKRYTTTQQVDGRSFVDLLQNPRLHRDREIIWHYPHLWTTNISEKDGYGPTSSIMQGDYHLIYYWRYDTVELYNVRRDIGEKNYLAPSNPRLTARLKDRLFSQLKHFNAQYPTQKQ